MTSQAGEWPKYQTDIAYSQHSKLNTLQVCQLQPSVNSDDDRIWIIYIHGGAWFDPEQTATTFNKAQGMLLESPIRNKIAGLASLNYRLSPPGPTVPIPYDPSDPARNAGHPDHINDVVDAISWLQQTYHFQSRYILAGHSCGAALTFQAAMGRDWSSSSSQRAGVMPPVALLGIEGLYDLPALVKYHESEPLYIDFVKSAFGSDKNQWTAVSPTSSNLNATWKIGKLAVIAHSHEDELVEWEQADLIEQSLKSQKFAESGDRRFKLLELRGKHDQVWKEGREVARAIEFTIQHLFGPTQKLTL